MNKTSLRQRGAALVVGLVLLLILTLLAISGMNTATTELIMAGNEQYQTRAFQAAETGIEMAIATARLNPALAIDTIQADIPDTNPNADDDRYSANVVPSGCSGLPPGFSIGEFHSEHFQISSAGTSLRNAASTHTQGIYLIAPVGCEF